MADAFSRMVNWMWICAGGWEQLSSRNSTHWCISALVIWCTVGGTLVICSILVQCLERAGRSHLEAINLLLLLLPLHQHLHLLQALTPLHQHLHQHQHLLLSTSSTYTQSAPARVIATIKMILMILIQVLLITPFCVSQIACSKQMTEGYNGEHKVEQLG